MTRKQDTGDPKPACTSECFQMIMDIIVGQLHPTISVSKSKQRKPKNERPNEFLIRFCNCNAPQEIEFTNNTNTGKKEQESAFIKIKRKHNVYV